MAGLCLHRRFRFGTALAVYLLLCIESGCSLYSSNITCYEGLPLDTSIGNDVMLMVNLTKNDSRLLTLDTGLNKSMLCKVAENILSETFGHNLDWTGPPIQQSPALYEKRTLSPLSPPPLRKFPVFPMVNISRAPEQNTTTNEAFDNANTTTLNSTEEPNIIITEETREPVGPQGPFGPVGPQGRFGPIGPSGPKLQRTFNKQTAAMRFAYSLQVLAENAFKERKRACHERQGTYIEDTGLCELNKSGNQTGQRLEVNENEDAGYYISVIGNSLSLLCLIALLVVYAKFKSLQTRPGKNIMCLSLAMAISQTLQLIALHTIKMPYLCTALGIALHWAYLATFTWMAIISFDLFITFAFPFSSGKFGRKNQFLIYICVSIVIPTVVVGICVAVDFSLDRVIGYGINICFIGSVWGNLFSYILFVALVMIFNTICLIATITKIHSSQEKSREMKGGDGSAVSDRLQLCLMALKVSTLTALGWIFGVIGGLLGNTPLIYIFLVLTSCQGIFVFLAFCCNKRVYLTVTGQSVDSSQASSSRERKTLLSSFRSQHGNVASGTSAQDTHV